MPISAASSRTVSPRGLPIEVKKLAEMSRVNIMEIVVSSVAQAMYVDGYRQAKQADDAPAWAVWQANGMDAAQIATHRSTLTYGTSYVTVLPGDPLPVIKGFSPRTLTVTYDPDNDEWPVWALRVEPNGKDKWLFRLYDDVAVYFLETGQNKDAIEFVSSTNHNLGVVPVVRFLNQMDLDDDNVGEVEPLMELQDQIDLTTFSLLVSQHYGAFRQRYAIGWTADSEEQLLKASAARLWTFDDTPDNVKVGEFEQTDLKGYLDSREASIRHAASLSQTPAHELLGQLVNLSAEALVAAEASQQRKIAEKRQSFGEAWEQVLSLAGQIANFEVADDAQVRWRDTESRALASTVDALGKMAQMLGVPVQELWERIPGVSQQDIERWRAEFAKSDALTNLNAMLDRQASGLTTNNNSNGRVPVA